MLCGTEEARRIMEKLRLRVTAIRPSGTLIKPGEVFLEAQGQAQDLHMAWKVCQNLLDFRSQLVKLKPIHSRTAQSNAVLNGFGLHNELFFTYSLLDGRHFFKQCF